MTVKELYEKMTMRIPEELREDWDNDGIMCAPDLSGEVRRVLLTLDVTEEIVDYAIENAFDLIVSHHPLVFRPLRGLSEEDPCARKLIKLVNNGVAVFSFHTRADKVEGGVNDLLADSLELHDVVPFGEGDLGRIGTLDEEATLEDFAFLVKQQLNSTGIMVSDGYNTVHRVAVVGGDGKDYVRAALEAGADTFVSGRIGYNTMEEAAELGINLLEAGHYFTECRITELFSSIISHCIPGVLLENATSNLLKLL